jgi:exodeoxyribonuclease VII small subunit
MEETTMAKATKTKNELSYGQAAERLEEILGTIEEGGVDVDALSGLVKEAAELVTLCRGKIRAAEVQVKTITEQLERESSEVDDEDLPEDIRH